jgi:hypothetical protein
VSHTKRVTISETLGACGQIERWQSQRANLVPQAADLLADMVLHLADLLSGLPEASQAQVRQTFALAFAKRSEFADELMAGRM